MLTATGLGAYVTSASGKGDWAREALGITMMSIFVVTFNRLIWRRLYDVVVARFTL